MKRILLLSGLFTCLFMIVNGQVPYIPDTPFESLHLTTDRDLYLAGETIWFATFDAIPFQDEETTLSQVIYAELFDAGNKIIARGKFLFKNGRSSGQLKIPYEQPSGVYFVRVYTQYLRNFNPATWPMKGITIINPTVPLEKKPGLTGGIFTYPSPGGGGVPGNPPRVAVFVPGTRAGEISAISLLERDTVVIPEIDYFPNGLGYFKFTPGANADYSLVARLKNGDTIRTPFHINEGTGTFLTIEETKERLICKINRKVKSPLAKATTYYLTVSSGKFATLRRDSIRSSSPVLEFILEKKILSPGINWFSLHDEAHHILDIQAYYHIPAGPVLMTIKSDKSSYKPREQVTLKFELPGSPDEVISHASISVVKQGTVREKEALLPAWIIDQPALLTPEMIAGQEHSPDLQVQVKALMILYRARLLEGNNLVDELLNDRKKLDYLPEIRNVSISGYVRNKTTGVPAAASKVFLSTVGGPSQIHINQTQQDGFFIFPVAPYREVQDLFLCTFDENPDQEILINTDYSNEFPDLREIPLRIDTGDRRLLEELYINHQLHEKLFGGGREGGPPVQMGELGFGTPEISIRPENYVDLPSMDVVLNEIVPFVKVRKRKGDFNLTILDSETGLSYENHLVMVDNIPLGNINELMQIHPSAVEQIDVINRTYVIGDHTFQGIIQVKTLTGNFGGITLPADAVFIQYPLISNSDTFIPASFRQDDEDAFPRADLRNVLYWDPDFSVSSGDTLSFFASDHLSGYEVVLEGITSKGRRISGRGLIHVRKQQ